MGRVLDSVSLSGDLSVSIGDVAVGHNELITRFSLNRNYRKLVENDISLLTLYNRITGGVDIDEWNPNVKYPVGTLVWYTSSPDCELYLLRNLVHENTLEPNPKDFADTGWRNENEHKTILDYGLEKTIAQFARKLMKSHQDSDLHPLGSLSGTDMLDRKLLRRDFSNIDVERETNFYPYMTVDMLSVEPSLSDVVLDGYYRVYDNGLLEYDVTYRMGYVGQEEIDGDIYDTISCNCIDFHDTSRLATRDPARNEVAKYFFNTGDYTIFRNFNDSKDSYSIIGDTVQRNRNDYCNVYHAKIKFPQNFSDLGYSVFGTQVTCQDISGTGIPAASTGLNQLVYCDKTTGSITALLITFPTDHFDDPGYNATHGGLLANTFHLKAIGFRK